jgi:hypothetical protein
MVRKKSNIQDKHFEYDRENEEFTCKTCGSTHSEMDAIMHLMEVHGYNHIDIILDEPIDD